MSGNDPQNPKVKSAALDAFIDQHMADAPEIMSATFQGPVLVVTVRPGSQAKLPDSFAGYKLTAVEDARGVTLLSGGSA